MKRIFLVLLMLQSVSAMAEMNGYGYAQSNANNANNPSNINTPSSAPSNANIDPNTRAHNTGPVLNPTTGQLTPRNLDRQNNFNNVQNQLSARNQ